MRYGDYIPDSDRGAADWMDSFASALLQDPHRFGVAPATAAYVRQIVDEYLHALTVATTPPTRTTPAIATKDERRNNAKALCRDVAQQIKLNNGVSTEAKKVLGIRPRNPARRQVTAPGSSPILKIITNAGGGHLISCNDSPSPERKAKPFGVKAIQIYKHIGKLGEQPEASVQDIEMDCRFVGQFNRTPFMVKHQRGEKGRTITYWGRWISTRSETGPWSLPASMIAA